MQSVQEAVNDLRAMMGPNCDESSGRGQRRVHHSRRVVDMAFG
jgi:hypothetical protein